MEMRPGRRRTSSRPGAPRRPGTRDPRPASGCRCGSARRRAGRLCPASRGRPPRTPSSGAPNRASASQARFAFSGVGSTQRSMSFVYRGTAWNETAWAPTTRKRTSAVENADSRSLKSGFRAHLPPECPGLAHHLPDGGEPPLGTHFRQKSRSKDPSSLRAVPQHADHSDRLPCAFVQPRSSPRHYPASTRTRGDSSAASRQESEMSEGVCA